jgi:hypothetical protein
MVKKPGAFFVNCFKVLAAQKTWVGYSTGYESHLPAIKKGIIPPFNIMADYTPSAIVKAQINTAYAQHYTPLTDINLLLKNYKYLGGS